MFCGLAYRELVVIGRLAYYDVTDLITAKAITIASVKADEEMFRTSIIAELAADLALRR
jgi:hypothetical protein